MLVVLRRFRDHDFRREQQARDRRRVLQRETRDLGRVEDALFQHVAVLARAGVVAVGALARLDGVQDNRGIFTGVFDDLTQRLFDRARQDADADRLVFVRTFELVEGLLRADQRNAAARDHAFFNGGTGRVQRVFDAGLLFLHFDLGGSANLDHGNATGELGNTLLELLLVVVRSGFFSLLTDRLDARLDVRRLAGAVDDRAVLFLHDHFLGFAEIVDGGLLELQTDFIRNHRAAREDCDVLQHGLATIAKARGLDGSNLEDAADVVDHERRESFAFDVLADHEQGTALLRDRLEQRQHFADVRDLLVRQEDQRLFELNRLVRLLVDEIRRKIAAVELHALDHVEFVLEARAFFHRDHAFLADLLHRFRDGLADGLVGVRRDRADLGNRLVVLAGLGELLHFFDSGDDRLVDAALDVHRVAARGNGLEAFADDRLREHGGGGGAVASFVRGVGSDFLHHLRAHVLELVLELDFLRDRHAVLGDGGGAEALLEHGIAALGAERRLDGVGENVDAAEHLHACVIAESYFFSCHDYLPSMTAMTSSSRMTTSSSPSTFTSVPEYLPNRILSPTFTSSARTLPSSKILPLPTATILPCTGFSAAESGITMPPAETRSSSRRFTITRS